MYETYFYCKKSMNRYKAKLEVYMDFGEQSKYIYIPQKAHKIRYTKDLEKISY